MKGTEAVIFKRCFKGLTEALWLGELGFHVRVFNASLGFL